MISAAKRLRIRSLSDRWASTRRRNPAGADALTSSPAIWLSSTTLDAPSVSSQCAYPSGCEHHESYCGHGNVPGMGLSRTPWLASRCRCHTHPMLTFDVGRCSLNANRRTRANRVSGACPMHSRNPGSTGAWLFNPMRVRHHYQAGDRRRCCDPIFVWLG